MATSTSTTSRCSARVGSNAAADAPVEDGTSLELKLVEVGLQDPTAGVGKIDGGYEVVVAGAAKLVGKM